MECVFKKGSFYYYKTENTEDWAVTKFNGVKFEVDRGLTVTVGDMVEQCSQHGLLEIPSPEVLNGK